MPLGPLTVVDEASGLLGLAGSGVMVEVDEERLKVLARGAKCVSLSSESVSQRSSQDGDTRAEVCEDILLVSFQDMAKQLLDARLCRGSCVDKRKSVFG